MGATVRLGRGAPRCGWRFRTDLPTEIALVSTGRQQYSRLTTNGLEVV